jgi:hypothetical protein
MNAGTSFSCGYCCCGNLPRQVTHHFDRLMTNSTLTRLCDRATAAEPELLNAFITDPPPFSPKDRPGGSPCTTPTATWTPTS